ncbi:electron transport complex subunit RsxG [Methylomagnum sp.]
MNPFKLPRHPAALLGLFSLVGLGLVALVHDHTAERIAANERAVLLQTLETLIPADSYDNDLLADTVTVADASLGSQAPLTVYRARKDGRPVAVALSPTAPDGYNGAIRLLVAIRADGQLAGVRALSHRETPGLGDFIDAGKSDWIHGFTGRSLENPPESRWQVKRDGGDFDQFAGATVTPRAVVRAVRNALVFFRVHQKRLFGDAAGTAF